MHMISRVSTYNLLMCLAHASPWSIFVDILDIIGDKKVDVMITMHQEIFIKNIILHMLSSNMIMSSL